MTFEDIANHRLINQQIENGKFSSPKELVSWMGAIQAQDYSMAKWAIGVRIKNSTDHLIEKAIDNAEIIRTHVLRPTWHFIAAKDIRWMLELTAPRLHTILNSNNRKLELTDKIFNKSNSIIEKLLSDGKQLTREEIMIELRKNKIATDDIRSAHIMFRAELEQLVCNGSRRGKQFTYALMDERVSKTKTFDREEAVAELAKRYFTSHGPTTLQDFVWWSGLKIVDAKLALELNKKILHSVNVKDQTYWFIEKVNYKKSKTDTIHFLPGYDEYTISYKDRSASLDVSIAKHAMSGNGIFKPIIVVNGKVKGIWKRTIKKDKILVEPFFLKAADQPAKKAMENALQSYAHFMGEKVELMI